MAITVVSDQTTLSTSESLTSPAWTATAAWSTAHVLDGDEFIEGANSIGARAAASVAGTFTAFWDHVTTPANLDLTTGGNHVYFWINCTTLPSTASRTYGGVGISISSTAAVALTTTFALPWQGIADSKQWFVSGNDFDTTTGWVCYVVDPASTSDFDTGTPVMTSVDRVGIRAGMLQVVGAGSFKPHNFCWDRLSYGTKLTITGSTGTFADIEAQDSLTANRYGILSKTAGIFFPAGKLVFGTTSQASPTVFTDTNQVLVWKDFRVAAGFYEINLAGNTTPNTTTFTLGNYTSGLITGGCVIKGAGLNTQRLIASVIVSGGTGYTAGNILTVSGGTGTAATMKVIAVSTGVITELRMETGGSYSVPPTGTLTLTGGSGASATATATVVGGSIWTFTANATNTVTNLYGSTFSEMKTATFGAAVTVRGCTFDNFGNITANGTFFDSCTFQNLRTATPISATYAVDATTTIPTLTNCKFLNSATALRWPISSFDTNGALNGTSFTSGGTGHAIEFTGTATSRTLTNVTFSGYAAVDGSTGNEAIYVNIASGTMTLTIAGSGNTPSIRTAGATVTVVAGAVSVTITTTDVSGTAIQNANVYLPVIAGGPFPYQASVTISNSGTTATVTHTAHGLATNDKVIIKGASLQANNGVFTITKINTNSYSYTMGSSPGSSPTGTITSTFVVLYGLTDASGQITMSRVFSSAQPISGWARKSTSPSFYKTALITGSVSATSGFSATALLIADA